MLLVELDLKEKVVETVVRILNIKMFIIVIVVVEYFYVF